MGKVINEFSRWLSPDNHTEIELVLWAATVVILLAAIATAFNSTAKSA